MTILLTDGARGHSLQELLGGLALALGLLREAHLASGLEAKGWIASGGVWRCALSGHERLSFEPVLSHSGKGFGHRWVRHVREVAQEGIHQLVIGVAHVGITDEGVVVLNLVALVQVSIFLAVLVVGLIIC